jgi:alpha-glucosidase
MKTTPPLRKQDVRDPIGITGWPKEKGRDGERTPMQWTPGPNAGFSKPGVKTWLPIPDSFITVNVQNQVNDPNSMLNWYKQLIQLRHTVPAFREGRQIMLDTDNNQVLSWLRYAPGHAAIVVACNFTDQPQTIGFNLTAQGVHSKTAKTLIKTPGGSDPTSLDQLNLPPFGVYIGEVQ